MSLSPDSPPVSSRVLALKGHPVQIVIAREDHTFDLDEDKLEKILLKPSIQNKKVVVISVTGAFRKGKSFLLDFFLRYLSSEGSTDWLGEDDCPLEGFSWRGGSERETTGILFWSEPFICRLPNEEQVAVLFMDTQGAFDSESTVKDCATVFALSTMISSVQVYNLSHNIQEDDLQHLQLFMEYGRLALEANGNESKPFQVLEFLVRDWSYPYDAEYGAEGGLKMLDKRLKISDKQHLELQQIRQHIQSCFSKIGCFLMPHPGLKVSTSPHFDGRLKDIEADFKTLLKNFVQQILAKENLVVKEINGCQITCRDLVEYFKAYIKIYQGEELPEPKSMLQCLQDLLQPDTGEAPTSRWPNTSEALASWWPDTREALASGWPDTDEALASGQPTFATAEANNLVAVSAARSQYIRDISEVCGGGQVYINPTELEMEHQRCRQLALNSFRTMRKMGGPDFSKVYLQQLEGDIEMEFNNFQKQNEHKNIFSATRTPVVLVTVMIVLYIVNGVFGVMGMESIASIFHFMTIICLFSMFIWFYIQYSGEYRFLSAHIDHLASVIWEQALAPVYAHLMYQGANLAVRQASSNSHHRN